LAWIVGSTGTTSDCSIAYDPTLTAKTMKLMRSELERGSISVVTSALTDRGRFSQLVGVELARLNFETLSSLVFEHAAHDDRLDALSWSTKAVGDKAEALSRQC
jgi:hypothetical protein